MSSLSKPGGNLTGIFFDFPDFSTKWLELMRAVLPDLSRVAVLWDPGTGPLQLQGLRKAAAIMAVELRVIEVKSVDGMHQAFADARAESLEGAVILSSPIFGSNPARTAELALEHLGPRAFRSSQEFAFSGGLLAYGPYVSDLYRQSGQIVAKVLAGTPPGELPIESAWPSSSSS